MNTLTAAGHRIEFAWCEPSPAPLRQDAPVLVFLHEGLGSLAMWRDFPGQVANATGCRALVYSRYGYGKSDRLVQARQIDYMHAEATEALPDVLAQLGIDNPVLIGHSDGASIALIHAGAQRWPVRGVVLLAPHVFVEDLTLAGIAQAKTAYRTTDLRDRLGRYHDDPDSTFRGWNDIWLASEFRQWNIEEFLPRIRCPVLAIQGTDDEYGTMAQIDRIARQAADVKLLKLAGGGHSPHRDRTDEMVMAIKRFVEGLTHHREDGI